MISPESWHPADGLTLETNALRAATERTRSLALTAGPGAGKTEMLAQRADFLLRTGTCQYPMRILAISFKVDAAANLRDRVRRRCGPNLAVRFDSHTFHAFAKRIIDRFRPLLTGLDALNPDYTIGEQRVTREQITYRDLVPLAIEILKKSAMVRNTVRQTYAYAFLDEFQDCTNEQYSLIKRLFFGASIPLTAVGDTKQKIMTFAGALDGIFLTFARDFDASTLNLYLNFRSKPRLLRMQNSIIEVMDPQAVMPEEQIQGEEGEIQMLHYDDNEQEAESLAEEVERWLTVENLPPSEVAVLVPRLPEQYCQDLMSALRQRGIKFRNENQLQDLAAEPAAHLIVDYLLVLYGSREPRAYGRLMEKLTAASYDEEEHSRLRTGWGSFLHTQRLNVSRQQDRSFEAVWDEAETFLKKFGIDQITGLSADYRSKARRESVIQQTKERLGELLEEDLDVAQALAHFGGHDALRIMSIHKSKGLEFDTVVILGVENESFWANEDEERCLFFVGISRAKRRLVLTHCDFRERPTAYTRQWMEERSGHEEFLGYAEPFVLAAPE
jgi:superfamily I DNA/RNA helicase